VYTTSIKNIVKDSTCCQQKILQLFAEFRGDGASNKNGWSFPSIIHLKICSA